MTTTTVYKLYNIRNVLFYDFVVSGERDVKNVKKKCTGLEVGFDF